MRFIPVDSGGVSRKINRLFIVDGGNTARLIKRLFVIDSGNVARQVFAGQITFNMNSSTSGVERGYQNGGFGTVDTVVGLDAGLTIQALWDEVTGFTSHFQVTGFGANPGQSWFTQITSNGHTFSSTAADVTYSFVGATASWVWSSSFFGFSGTPTAYPTTVTR